jgi:hypothetical protein
MHVEEPSTSYSRCFLPDFLPVFYFLREARTTRRSTLTMRHGTSTSRQNILSCILTSSLHLPSTTRHWRGTTAARQTENLGEIILRVVACLNRSVLLCCEYADGSSRTWTEKNEQNTEKAGKFMIYPILSTVIIIVGKNIFLFYVESLMKLVSLLFWCMFSKMYYSVRFFALSF